MKTLIIGIAIFAILLLGVGCGKENKTAQKVDTQAEEPDRAQCCMDSLMAVDGRLVMSPDDTGLARKIADCMADKAKTTFERALVEIGRCGYSAAIVILSDVLRESEDNPAEVARIYYYQGIAQYMMNDTLKALDAFDSSIVYNGTSPDAWTSRAIALGDLGRYNEAVADYNSAVALKRDYYEAWYHWANALVSMGQFKDAVDCYDSAITYKYDMIKARYNQAVILHRLGRLNEAIAGFDSVIAYKHDDYEAWSGRGLVLGKQNDFEKAIVCFDSALAYKHDYPAAWNNKAAALAVLKRYDEALECIDSSFHYEPENPQTLKLQNLILKESGKALE